MAVKTHMLKPQGYLGLMQLALDIVIISNTSITHCLGPPMTDEMHKFSIHSQFLDSAQENKNTKTSAFQHAQVKQAATMLK